MHINLGNYLLRSLSWYVGSSGKNGTLLIMHENGWACHRKSCTARAVQKNSTAGKSSMLFRFG